ncbi:MAG: acetyl-CoA decarbonylase/synthase complex subunit delta [Candidatus Omnitrophica bacterium CG1_02_49_10]|nr:MAG: acetyl-CoA decarbonylase/synthase complex subunit delta [Candidatus Omnitrophica bacterium CG1_02_49_10]
MALELIRDKWANKINELTIGASQEEGGTRSKSVKVGGETTLPFLFNEGDMPNRPVVAMEVWDVEPKWPASLKEPFGDALKDPSIWAKRCVEEFKADLICLKLQGAHPENAGRSPEDCEKTVRSVLDAVKVPLIILGSGDNEKDNVVLPKASHAAKGERCLMGFALQDNYKTLTVSCNADGHSVIALAPIDINIAKQLNILITDMDFDPARIVIYQTTTSLGYGMEYVYSINERTRIAGLSGDKMMAMPMIAMVGQEVWRVKEASAPKTDEPAWGDEKERGPAWEAATAAALLQSGTDILVMRHPKAVSTTLRTIDELMKG